MSGSGCVSRQGGPLLSGSRSLRWLYRPAGPLQLLVLGANGHAVDVHRDGYDDLGFVGSFGAGLLPPVNQPRLYALPLGAPVLEPDFDLHLAQFERVSDLRALRERQVLLTVELLLQLQQLLACERRPPPTRLPAATSGRRPAVSGSTASAVAVTETVVAVVHAAVAAAVAHGVPRSHAAWGEGRPVGTSGGRR